MLSHMPFVKSVLLSATTIMLMMFLVAAATLLLPLLSFSSLIPNAAASPATTNTTTTMNATTSATTPLTPISPTTTTIELGDEPFAMGYYRTISDDMTSETEAEFSFEQGVQFTAEGNTTITLPNSTETITTRDTAEGTFSFLSGGAAGSPHGQIHMTTEDGSESVTVNFTEFIRFDESIGVGIAYFSTNSTGMLAPLNNMIAVYLDEVQPNEDSIVSFFEWKHGDSGVTGASDAEPAPHTTPLTS